VRRQRLGLGGRRGHLRRWRPRLDRWRTHRCGHRDGRKHQAGGWSWSTGAGGRCTCSKRTSPTRSACAGACAAAWPVDNSSGTPKAGSGVKASLLGTIKRSDNTPQVTYNHHPLYYYSGDSGVGQQNGQGLNAFGAAWFLVAPAGGKVG